MHSIDADHDGALTKDECENYWADTRNGDESRSKYGLKQTTGFATRCFVWSLVMCVTRVLCLVVVRIVVRASCAVRSGPMFTCVLSATRLGHQR